MIYGPSEAVITLAKLNVPIYQLGWVIHVSHYANDVFVSNTIAQAL